MFKFIGICRNGSSKLRRRTSDWCIPNYQILSAYSDGATTPELKINIRTKKHIKSLSIAKEKSSKSILNAVFQSLDKDMKKEKQNKTLADELLDIVDRGNVNFDRAMAAMITLHEWAETGKIDRRDFEENPKYHKLRVMLKTTKSQHKSVTVVPSSNLMLSPQIYNQTQENLLCDKLRKMSIPELVDILIQMVGQQERNKTLLSLIANQISQMRNLLNIKHISDILYSMARLSFSDSALLVKLCNDLKVVMKPVRQSAIVGSIVTSLGMLRYRDENILNSISVWAVENEKKLRTQDICALILTLATVGYNPENSEILFERLISPLKEIHMIKTSEWLEVVWARTILNNVTPEIIESVLNPRFAERLLDGDTIPTARKIKLLNINAAAKYLMNDYSGPFLPDDSQIFDVEITKSKAKQLFVKSISDAISNLFPSNEYYQLNVNSKIGFLLDIEFFMGKNRIPLQVREITEDTVCSRVGLVANCYHDYSIGMINLLGATQLHHRLLKAQGYQILKISYDDFNMNDKLLDRISYINTHINSIIQ